MHTVKFWCERKHNIGIAVKKLNNFEKKSKSWDYLMQF